ncbi:hypothetical protein CPY51_08950 [Rhizobium tubonense]|uniref:Uncharacterized protein n=1 Tax=Rhizobium tubonense TaxID=484088 RepID=A0A2W4CQK1_9HYPH|nr:hypothetical protein CPY51_08950 [Rhizobium tubonense]
MSVTTATDGSLDEAALVIPAKAMLQQLTSFPDHGDTSQVTSQRSDDLDGGLKVSRKRTPEVPAAFGLEEPPLQGPGAKAAWATGSISA